MSVTLVSNVQNFFLAVCFSKTKRTMFELIMYVLQIGGIILLYVIMITVLVILTLVIICCGINFVIALGAVLLATAIFILILMYLTGSTTIAQYLCFV